MVRDMTEGSPLKLIIGFTIPMAIGNIFQQLYSMADTIIVGKFVGVEALAAVGSTSSLNFMVLGFVMGICGGFTIPISQCFGAEDMKGMRRCVANSIYLNLALTGVLTVIMLLFTRTFLQWMRTPADIFESAYSYIIIIFGGMLAMMLYNLLSGFLRALGDSRTPLVFLIFSSAANIILDLVFILVFDAGIAGAAWATVISQLLSGILCFLFIRKRLPVLHLNREDMRLDFSVMKRLLQNGIPMALQFSITAVGSVIIQTAVNTLGSTVVAAITTAARVQSLLTQPMESVGMTAATYCGQNLGAGRIDRLHQGFRKLVLVTGVYAVFSMMIAMLFGSTISLLFLDQSETAILDLAQLYLRWNGAFFLPLSMIFIFRNGLQGMGFGFSAMLAGVFEMIARSAVAFLLVPPLGFNGACLSNPAAWVAADLLLIPMYFHVIRDLDRKAVNGRIVPDPAKA